MRIADALDLPRDTGLDHFIAKLDSGDAAQLQRNLAQFVVTKGVHKQLDALFTTVGERFAQGLDVGRFIHGSFGTGKSHLMTVLGKVFERNEEVYRVGDPLLRDLRAAHPWIDEGKALVVRLNMMGKTSLLHGLYDAFNAALPDGVPAVSLTQHEKVFELFEKDAARMGGLEAAIDQLVTDKAIGSRRFYERNRAGTQDQQVSLAAKIEGWRNHGETALKPEDLWLDGEGAFKRIGAHAQAHGYDRVVWLIDELIIWIRGKSGAAYAEQLNMLSALVDHDQRAARPVPFLLLLAVQQDIKATCPDDLSEADFHQHLRHISDRFRPWIELEEQDLFEVAARRVLKPRADVADQWNAEVDRTFTKHRDAILALSGDLPLEQVRRLYPFHPALLRVLVDVTQVLSRSRSAMAVLYKLLQADTDLEVGQFVPVGALYEQVFTTENLGSLRDLGGRSKLAERLWLAHEVYESIEPQVPKAATEAGMGADEAALLVRTVLLCQLSTRPYFKQDQSLAQQITARTLFRLNQSRVKVLIERSGVSKVTKLFRSLAGDPRVQVRGEGQDPRVEIKTENIDMQGVLKQAQAQLQAYDRFSYCRKLLDEQLALNVGGTTEVARDVRWRGTKRRGTVRLVNVRRLSYAGAKNEFDPGERDFLLLVDYPFDDDPTKTQQDDVDTVQRARGRKRQWSVAWLPAHFTAAEREMLDKAAAVDRIRAEKRTFITDEYSPNQARRLMEALEGFQSNLAVTLGEAIRRVYFDEGLVEPLSDALSAVTQKQKDPGKAIDTMIGELLDARYPRHPRFKRDVRRGDLSKVADWVVRANQLGSRVDLKKADLALVENIAVPMELVYANDGSIAPRPDGRVLRALHDWIGDRTEFGMLDLKAFLAGEAKEGFGFTDDLVQFWGYYLLQAEGYEARSSTGRGQTVDCLTGVADTLTLVKADVVDAATWEHARRVAQQLLAVTGRRDVPSVPEQSKLTRDVQQASDKRGKRITAFEKKLEQVCAWAGVDPAQSKRASAVATYRAALNGVNGHDDAADVARALADLRTVPGFDVWRSLAPAPGTDTTADLLLQEANALEKLDAHAQTFATVARLGTEAEQGQVVVALRNLLLDPVGRPLTVHVPEWAETARVVMQEVLRRLEDEERERKERERIAWEKRERERKEREERERKEREARERKEREERERKAQEERDRKEQEKSSVTQQRVRKGVTTAQVAATAQRLASEALEALEGEHFEVTVIVRRGNQP